MLDKRLRSPGRHHVLEAPEDHLLTGGGHPAIFNVKSGAARRPPMRSWVSLSHIPHPRRREQSSFLYSKWTAHFPYFRLARPLFSTPGTDALKHFKILG